MGDFSYCAPYYYGPGVVLVRGGVRVESKRTEPATEQGEATEVGTRDRNDYRIELNP